MRDFNSTEGVTLYSSSKYRDCFIEIEGLTPYSSSKHVEENLLKGEKKDDHEKRRWREKLHVDAAGVVFIPGVAFKLALDETAALRNEKIVGKGNQTYTNQFRTGVVALGDVSLGIKAEDVQAICIFAHSNGKRGPGTRVNRWFPLIPEWAGRLHMRVFNDTLPADVFERYFEDAGILAGIGRGRPITGCPAGNGRFRAIKFEWK